MKPRLNNFQMDGRRGDRASRWHLPRIESSTGDAGFYGGEQRAQPKWTTRLCHGHEGVFRLLEKHPRNKALRSARMEAAMLWLRKLSSRGAEGKMWPGAANAELSPAHCHTRGRNRPESTGAAATLAAPSRMAAFHPVSDCRADTPESAEPYFRQALRLKAGDAERGPGMSPTRVLGSSEPN